jgi:hypothetical protein
MNRIWIVTLVLFSTLAIAEEKHDEAAEAAKSEEQKTAAERPKQKPTSLKPEETKLLSTLFRIPTGSVQELFGGSDPASSIPKGVDAAMAGDEAPLARIIADLYGTLNRNQADVALGVIEKERSAELDKNPRDGRYVALLDRLFWAGKILDGDPAQSEGSQKYNATFEQAFKDRQARTAIIQEKVKEALAGNNQAKDFLRNKVNRKTLMAFIDAQRKSGNGKLANDLLAALAFGGENGQQKFIDFKVGKETHRLNLGLTPESMEKALALYSEKNGGLHTATITKKPSQNPTRTFSVKDGKIDSVASAQPATGGSRRQASGTKTASNGTDSTSKAKDSAETPKGGAPGGGGTPSTGGGKPAAGGGSSSGGASGLGAFLTKNCAGCHGEDPVAGANGKIKKGDQEYTIAETVKKVNSIKKMREGVPQAVKDQLAAFAR